VASTHFKPVNPSVIYIKLAKSRLKTPRTPRRRLAEPAAGRLGLQSTLHKQIAPIKNTALLPRSARRPKEAIETDAAGPGNHAANPSNFKGLFVPCWTVILFKNAANSAKTGTNTDIKPFRHSCRMQITHQGNSLPWDRYCSSQRTKRHRFTGYTSVATTKNLHLLLEFLRKSSSIHLHSHPKST